MVTILPHPDDREMVQFGLTLSRGMGTQLRVWTFHRPGADLHPALRIARYGMAATSEADRAIRHLMESASRGGHVPVRPFSDDPGARAEELAAIHALPDPTPLVVGRVQGRSGLAWPDLQELTQAHPGPTVVLVGRRDAPLREILALSNAPHDDPAHQTLMHLLAPLEMAYPTFRLRLEDGERLRQALADVGRKTLVIAAADGNGLLGTLDGSPPLWDRHPGSTAVVFPPGGARAPLRDAVLARLAEGEGLAPS